ncbi:caspase domain-containing protein [Mycena leptocephala]|nr:caspase domain-containing protein [Mycena leptocephala]
MADSNTGTKNYCALIIGIDQYASPDIFNLRGCVNDANAFEKFVKEKLGVPDTQIEVLRNDQATRANIIAKFKSFLIDNNRIRDKGDAIIFFYAGHGGDPPAYTPKGKVETICPYDERLEVNGRYIHGIPDFTFYRLFNELAATKGNNITAIFDSCHSGGIGRLDAIVRYAPGGAKIPAELDSEYFQGFPERSMSQEAPFGFAHKHMESHVLLAACHETQLSYEGVFNDIRRGYFSESLERQLRTFPLETTTNRDIIHLTGSWERQHPQVEGVHKNRALFSETYPKAHKAVPVFEGKEPGLFEIKMGSTSAVVIGTEFLVSDAEHGDAPIGCLKVSEVAFHFCVCVFTGPDGPTKPGSAWKAVVSKWNHTMLKVFLSPGFDPAVAAALFPADGSVDGSGPEGPKIFSQVEIDKDGDIELRVQREGQLLNFTVVTLNGLVTELELPETKFSLDTADIFRLQVIMDAIARFHYFLNLQSDMQPIHGVNLEMHTLQDRPEWKFVAGRRARVRDPSPNILDAQMKADVAKTDKLGYTFVNTTELDVFPYLFAFDPPTFSIFKCYAPQATERVGRSPKLVIGYNVGDEAFILDGTPPEVGILKVFLSTENLQIDWIEQESPLTTAVTFKESTWDAFHAIVTMK